MIFRKDVGKPVAVIVPRAGNLARYESFEASLEGLEAPIGSFVVRVRGSSALALGVNMMVKRVIAEPDAADVGGFFFIDDDHDFDSGTLLGLLASTSEQVRVVMALCMRKEPNFDFMAFTGSKVDEQSGVRRFSNLTAAQVAGQHGVLALESVGRGGLLVMRDVFEKIPAPWFKVGQINPEEFQEDMYFSDLCRLHGFQPYVHLDVHTGHTEPVTVTPHRLDDGRVVPMLKWGNGRVLVLRGWGAQA